MPNSFATKMALIDHEPVKKPCMVCGCIYYLVPFKRTSEAVICSEYCYNVHIGRISKEDYDRLRLH